MFKLIIFNDPKKIKKRKRPMNTVLKSRQNLNEKEFECLEIRKNIDIKLGVSDFFIKQICRLLSFFAALGFTLNASASSLIDTMTVEELQPWMAYRFRPITEPPLRAKKDTPEQIRLGETLFHDVRLSKNDNISCASCHPVKNNARGMDSLPTSPGTHGKFGTRNTPTVWNAAFHGMMFWDGRAKSLEEQAGMPLINELEMDLGSEENVVKKVRQLSDYKTLFKNAYPDDAEPINFKNIVNSIAAFERTLITTARFDDFVSGDLNALNEQEIRGMRTFMRTDCKECHSGSSFGGNNADKLGIKHPYPNQQDLGRIEVTGVESDRMKFKVASLRNVAITAPYFHNGEVATLEEAIKLMAWHQKGVKLTPEEIEDIAAFLNTLTGKIFEAPPKAGK